MICVSKCPKCQHETLRDLRVRIDKETGKIDKIIEKEIIKPEDFLENIRKNVKEQIMDGKNVDEIKDMLRYQYLLSELGIEKMIDVILAEKRLIIKEDKFVYIVDPINA